MPPNFIPHPDGGQMLAPLQYPEAHTMTLDEIEQHFVTGAPYEAERRHIFSALKTYCQTVWSIVPDAELWVNGGFCTLKDWAAPSDVDVVFVLSLEEYQRVKADYVLSSTVSTLLTKKEPGTHRVIRPYAGRIDGYILVLGLPPIDRPGLGLVTQEQYWHQQWSNVKAQNGTVHAGVRKGFIKVVNPWTL